MLNSAVLNSVEHAQHRRAGHQHASVSRVARSTARLTRGRGETDVEPRLDAQRRDTWPHRNAQ
eukprot:6928771-Pyramimonas_sp.AAC.1